MARRMIGWGRGRGPTLGSGVVAGLVSLGVLCWTAVPTAAGSAPGSADWSTFGHDHFHTGVSPNTSPDATSAASLALKWRTFSGNTQGILASPVVVYNATLGKSLVYVATEGAPSIVSAIDAATGATVWTYSAPASVRDTPSVSGNTVYFGTHDHSLYALNATTGHLVCSYATTGQIESSPVVGNVDGTGDVVFFGDIGLGEKRNAGHEWAVNGVGNTNGNCTLKWSFNSFGVTLNGTRTGSWSSPALAQDPTGRWVVVFGSTNPDDSVYSLDAVTGTQIWRYATVNTTSAAGDKDVGAPPSVTPPGENGITDGAVYVPGKNQIFYALDLKTGALMWKFNLKAASGAGGKAICMPAVVDVNVLCTFNTYLYDLNANNGSVIWRSQALTAGSFVASPSVSGGAGSQVVFAGDLAGVEHAYALATGLQVFSYQTSTAIISSTAIAANEIFFGGMDGYEYALG